MIFEPRAIGDHTPVFIHETSIKQVCSYKYLDIHMDDKLSRGFMWMQFVFVCSKDCIVCVDLVFLVWSRKSCIYSISQL